MTINGVAVCCKMIFIVSRGLRFAQLLLGNWCGSDFSVTILEICGFRNVNFVVWDWNLV